MKSKMSSLIEKRARLFAASSVLLILSLCACGGKNDGMKIEDVPVPFAARKAEIGGAEKEQFNFAYVAAITAVRNRYKTTDDAIYEVPKEATWQQAAEFYDDRLKAKNYHRAQAELLQSGDAKILFWENDNSFGAQAVAVAFVEVGKNEDVRKFIIVCTARK